MLEQSRLQKSFRSPWQWIGAVAILLILAIIAIAPLPSPRSIPIPPGLTSCRQIGLVLAAYAQDHGGKYPTGQSSTGIFQKLYDEKYLSDPRVLYYSDPTRIAGKTKWTSGPIKPENVCWDVTIPLDSRSPDSLPLVFLTGYRVHYVPGGDAVPLKISSQILDGLPVCYKSLSVMWKKADSDGTVTDFLPSDFNPEDENFTQLTPEGRLLLSP
jgi:hypothetical protein